MGGRFLREETTGTFLGLSQTGLGITGYDNSKKKYQSTWIDNLHTTLYTSEGSLGADGRTLTSYGRASEPMTGERDRIARFVLTRIDDDRLQFEAYDVAAGTGYKVLEIDYVRRQ